MEDSAPSTLVENFVHDGRLLVATESTSASAPVAANKQLSIPPGPDARSIQISVGTESHPCSPSLGETMAGYVLSGPFLWCLATIVAVVAARKYLRRLLEAVIARIEAGGGVSIAGVLHLENLTIDRDISEIPVKEKSEEWAIGPDISGIILGEKFPLNRVDME